MKKIDRFKIKFKRRVFKIFIVSIIVVFVFKLLDIQRINLNKEKELLDLKIKTQIKINENNILQQQIDSGMSDEFIENYARQKLNMAYPEERIFSIISKN